MNAPSRLIAPTTLAGLANLELLARTVVEGTLIGLHRSARFGFSQEFAEYRPYVAGDDPRHIDWNVLARTDRTCVKRYFGDTNTRIMVLLDTSASMGIEPAPLAVSKLDYGRFLAAALIYLAARQHDAVGLAGFADDVHTLRLPGPGRRRAEALYHVLDGLDAARGRTNWRGIMDEAGRRLARRALVVMISDLYCDPAGLAGGLKALAAHGHDLLVVQVLDPAEHKPPFGHAVTLRDVETGAVLPVAPEDLRHGYPERLAAHVEALRTTVLEAGGHFLGIDTDQPLDRALADYLRFRERHP